MNSFESFDVLPTSRFYEDASGYGKNFGLAIETDVNVKERMKVHSDEYTSPVGFDARIDEITYILDYHKENGTLEDLIKYVYYDGTHIGFNVSGEVLGVIIDYLVDDYDLLDWFMMHTNDRDNNMGFNGSVDVIEACLKYHRKYNTVNEFLFHENANGKHMGFGMEADTIKGIIDLGSKYPEVIGLLYRETSFGEHMGFGARAGSLRILLEFHKKRETIYNFIWCFNRIGSHVGFSVYGESREVLLEYCKHLGCLQEFIDRENDRGDIM